MIDGNCHLCGQFSKLEDSHVWPRFAYKRFVCDLEKGGRFVDLQKMEYSPQQFKRSWFCRKCEERLGRGERYAANFLNTLEKHSADKYEYEPALLTFLASISWRTAKMVMETYPAKYTPAELTEACKRWKDFLLGKKGNVGPYSQHLFIAYDPTDVGHHFALGGQVLLQEHIVHSQIGPFRIIGLLQRSHLPRKELGIWDRSMILPAGGNIELVKTWRVGSQLTMPLAELLAKYESTVVQKAKEFHMRNPGALEAELSRRKADG